MAWKANYCALTVVFPPKMPYQTLARHYEPDELCPPEGWPTKRADSCWLVKVCQLAEQEAAWCVQTRYSKYGYEQLSELRRREQQTWYAKHPITFGANLGLEYQSLSDQRLHPDPGDRPGFTL